MKKFLIAKLVSLMLIGTAWAGTVHDFAKAIARTEGFYLKGTIPNRLHNPGDIRTTLAHAYPGQTRVYKGYAVFRNDAAGWAALENQIQRVIDGTSTKYTADMTMLQIAKVYAENYRYWGKTVCKILRVDPRLTFQEYFGLAPRVRMTWNSNADILRNILATPAGSVGLAATPTLSVQMDGGADAEI